MTALIKHNTTAPMKKSKIFSTSNNQPGVFIPVQRVEGACTKNNKVN